MNVYVLDNGECYSDHTVAVVRSSLSLAQVERIVSALSWTVECGAEVSEWLSYEPMSFSSFVRQYSNADKLVGLAAEDPALWDAYLADIATLEGEP